MGAGSPAEMQAQIFEKLVSADRDRPAKNKDLEKFSRRLTEALGDIFKTLLYHKVKTTAGEAHIQKITEALQNRSKATPLIVVTDDMEAAHALLRFDENFAALLSRFMFGGDLDTPITSNQKTLTASETGLLEIFSQQLVDTLRSIAKFDASTVTVANTGLVDLEDLGQVTGIVVPVSISAGSLTASLDLILRETVLSEPGTAEEDDDLLLDPVNDEVMKTVIVAKASLQLRPLTLGEARKIQIGDILQLAGGGSLAASIVVKNKPVLHGKLGRSSGWYSLQIAQPLCSSQADALHFV